VVDRAASREGLKGTSAWVVVTTLVLAATLFLPWAQSGSVSRTGWQVVASARRLGVVESEVGEFALVLFFAVPVLAFVIVVLFALDLHGWVAAVSLVPLLVTLLVGVATIGSSLDLRWGLWLNTGVVVADLLMVAQLLYRLGVTRD